MNYATLNERIIAGEYNTKLPYPPYRENKVDRDKHKESDRVMRELYRQDDYRLKEQFQKDLREYMNYEIGKPITDAQFKRLFEIAWDKGHSSGYHEVLYEASELVEIARLFAH